MPICGRYGSTKGFLNRDSEEDQEAATKGRVLEVVGTEFIETLLRLGGGQPLCPRIQLLLEFDERSVPKGGRAGHGIKACGRVIHVGPGAACESPLDYDNRWIPWYTLAPAR
jgi:hypothetical protein